VRGELLGPTDDQFGVGRPDTEEDVSTDLADGENPGRASDGQQFLAEGLRDRRVKLGRDHDLRIGVPPGVPMQAGVLAGRGRTLGVAGRVDPVVVVAEPTRVPRQPRAVG